MKTSNYIIIAFFTFLFGGVLALFVTAEFPQINNNDGKLFSKGKKLEPFSVIVAESGAHFQISTAENPHIESFYQLPDSCKFPPFAIRNDTLFVLAESTTNKQAFQDVIYCKDIKSIVAREHSNLDLRDFIITGKDTLIVKLNKAKVNLFLQDVKNQNGELRIEAQESEVYINGSRLKTMDVHAENSKIYTWNSSIGHLSGTIKNYSEIKATVMGKISVAVDSTSLINIHK